MAILTCDPPSPVYQDGDIIVGDYGKLGRQEKNPMMVGKPVSVKKKIESTLYHAMSHGGSLLPITKTMKKGKKSNKIIAQAAEVSTIDVHPVVEAPAVEERQSAMDVVFNTDFGTITLSVVGVLENALALCLIFRSAKEVIVTPKDQTEMVLVIQGKEHKVYYPGVQWTWLDNTKKLMVFFKVNDQKEETYE